MNRVFSVPKFSTPKRYHVPMASSVRDQTVSFLESCASLGYALYDWASRMLEVRNMICMFPSLKCIIRWYKESEDLDESDNLGGRCRSWTFAPIPSATDIGTDIFVFNILSSGSYFLYSGYFDVLQRPRKFQQRRGQGGIPAKHPQVADLRFSLLRSQTVQRSHAPRQAPHCHQQTRRQPYPSRH